MKKNRWLIALSAIAIHLSIGSVYAYSVLKYPIVEQLGWSDKTVTVSFTIAIALLGTSAATFGRFVEKWGPRKSATIAAIFFASGQLITGLAMYLSSIPLFYLGYGVVGGIGLGLGYISPVSTLVKWFPDRRGLATGMAVMGFGAGSLIAAPIITNLIKTVGLSNTFFIMASIYLVLMLSGASYIVKPPENWSPKSATSTSNGKKAKKPRVSQDSLQQLNASEAIRTTRFWLLWVMMFINISTGIMLISAASPLAQDKAGMSVTAAAAMVGIMGLFNGGGRIGWSAFSDILGRSNVFMMFFGVELLVMLTLPNVTNALLLQVLIFITVSMYGGSFALLPAFISDLFGTRQLGAIHGLLLTAWSAAGIFGPLLVAFINDSTGSYDMAFYIFAVLVSIALVISLVMKKNMAAFKQTASEKVS
ncbi:OFA family oxalate/formate antiporter-like MFS transporter [Streptohalobacillus salinus]|uniref:OFA family oxalate/formate antiporter-like MFS transporter n=1 Tax=Streptohalobacillus salinus TaxID=621096 RepID=A0A2V3WJX2_9BACI|nr:OFA family MFS transporter [Streptohalobacillus salinus]PXW89019.1 OFA family oxalate/formate antiporter-like MFS transporter [Streptohalobacillus salinus]